VTLPLPFQYWTWNAVFPYMAYLVRSTVAPFGR
jgi:hypothetical protein